MYHIALLDLKWLVVNQENKQRQVRVLVNRRLGWVVGALSIPSSYSSCELVQSWADWAMEFQIWWS